MPQSHMPLWSRSSGRWYTRSQLYDQHHKVSMPLRIEQHHAPSAFFYQRTIHFRTAGHLQTRRQASGRLDLNPLVKRQTFVVGRNLSGYVGEFIHQQNIETCWSSGRAWESIEAQKILRTEIIKLHLRSGSIRNTRSVGERGKRFHRHHWLKAQ